MPYLHLLKPAVEKQNPVVIDSLETSRENTHSSKWKRI